MTGPELHERVAALDGACGLAEGYLPADELAAARQVVDKVSGRLRHGTRHTVVALAGPTGAGKSTLFNALAGVSLSDTGVRRPTTGTVHACVWGSGAEGLLDWLGVTRRHHLDAGGDLDGLVLLDLPDFDSTVAEHRIEVDRIIELVDVLVWVLDPQKYADQALHAGYLRPLADHGSIMRFVLNKADSVPDPELPALVADAERRLVESGLVDPAVVPVTATGGHEAVGPVGVVAVRSLLAAEVEAKAAMVARLDADLRSVAERLAGRGEVRGPNAAGRRSLVAGLGRAAGIDTVAGLVGAQHRHDAHRATGWPPAVWLARRRRQPVADLPRPTTSAVASAEVGAALREAGEDASTGLGPPWSTAVRLAARDRHDEVVAALGSVTVGGARRARRPSWWWAPVAWLQRLLALIMLGGLGWLVVAAVAGGLLGLDTDPLLVDTPGLDWIPLPSLMLVGGALAGMVVAVLARMPTSVGATRRAGEVRRGLERQVDAIAATHVVEGVDAVLATRAEVDRLLHTAAGGRAP